MAEAPAERRRPDSFAVSPLDAPLYLSDLLPERGPELRSWTPPPSGQIAYGIQRGLEGLGVQPRKAASAGQFATDVLGLTPAAIPMAVGDTTHALSHGDYRGAALAALPLVPLPWLAAAMWRAGRRPGQEAFATYEAIPGTRTNHLPGLLSADDAARAAYSNDPRNSWAVGPRDRRDAIYSGMRRHDTGQPMQVMDTVETQGLYQNPRGQIETNPGQAARPTLGSESAKTKSISDGDRKVLEAVEATRGYIDAQDAAAFHKPWPGGPAGTSDSWFVPQEGKLSKEQLLKLRRVGSAHGFQYTLDGGRGATITNFGRNSNPFDPPESFLQAK